MKAHQHPVDRTIIPNGIKNIPCDHVNHKLRLNQEATCHYTVPVSSSNTFERYNGLLVHCPAASTAVKLTAQT
jgi:hypothetical protein